MADATKDVGGYVGWGVGNSYRPDSIDTMTGAVELSDLSAIGE